MAIPKYLTEPTTYQINRETHHSILRAKNEKNLNTGWRLAYFDDAALVRDDFYLDEELSDEDYHAWRSQLQRQY